MASKPSRKDTVAGLLERYGQTFASEAGIRLKDQPSPLYRLLCLSLLLSARISADTATAACRALAEAGWTTAAKLANATWRERTDVLNAAGYARYDESTSRMLGDTTELLLDRYRGDLRRLRAEAGCDPDGERKLLKEFKGIGNVGADIFSREVQGLWNELCPFADRRMLDVAKDLGLGGDAKALRRLVDSDEQYVQLSSALVRVGTGRQKPADVLAELAS